MGSLYKFYNKFTVNSLLPDMSSSYCILNKFTTMEECTRVIKRYTRIINLSTTVYIHVL